MSKKSLFAAVQKLEPGQNAMLLVDKGRGGKNLIGIHMHVPATPDDLARLLGQAIDVIANELENKGAGKAYKS